MLKQYVERLAEAEKNEITSNRKRATTMTADATSEDSLNDEKGGGSLDESASKSHHKQE